MDLTNVEKAREHHAEMLRLELERLTAELRRLGASKIVLFGSMARGRLDLFTDIDLLVVMNSSLPFVERCGWIYRELTPRVDADIIVYTGQEFESMKDSPFLRNALAEGVVLHEMNPA